MSIASEITRLSGVRGDIFTSITNKGVTVPATATFSSCPALIDSITGGGGGSPTSIVNAGFTASGFASGYRPFTATQNEVIIYEQSAKAIENYQTTSQNNSYSLSFPSAYFVDPNSASFVQLEIEFNADYQSRIQQVYLSPQANAPNFRIYPSYFGNSLIFDWTPLLQTFQQNSASWQWTIQNNSVWIVCQDTYYQPSQFSVNNYFINAVVSAGTELPYPDYPTTTTGYVKHTINLKEYFSSPNVKFSGYNYKEISYDSSPSDATVDYPSEINVTAFSANQLKNWLPLDLSAIDDNYTYTYGTTTSGYSGFEGI